MPDILKHQRSGSDYPPLEDGRLRFYSMQFCPYAQRTKLVLLMKNIPHETVNIHLQDKPSWYLDRVNPLGLVPTIQKGDRIVFDSQIINDFLDATYPEVRLGPYDPYQAAQERMLLEMWGKVVPPFYKAFLAASDDKDAYTPLLEELDKFESRIKNRTSPYFGGAKPSTADVNIWPHAYRIPLIFRLFAPDVTLDPARFPVFSTWMKKMAEIPAVKQTEIPDHVFKAFMVSVKNKATDYDIGLKE